jgi:hypothetical protein
VIRGCVEFATATTCKVCRNPDFILTTDGQCYDLNYRRKSSGPTGTWQNLFLRLSTNNPATSATGDYGFGTNYETCTAASNIYTCTTCFSARPNNIYSVTLSATEAAFFGSEIKFCHNNLNSDFTSSRKILINDGLTGSRDTSS